MRPADAEINTPPDNADTGQRDQRHRQLEVVLRETGRTVELDLEIGAGQRTAVGRCGQAGHRTRANPGRAHRGRTGRRFLEVVVEEADVVPAHHVGVLEFVIRDVERDAQRAGQRRQAAKRDRDVVQYDGRRRRRREKHCGGGAQGRSRLHTADHVVQRHLQRVLLEIMRIQRRHLDAGHGRVQRRHALDDFTVDRGAPAVADEVQRRAKQAAASLQIEVGQRGVQGFGRGFTETRITDVGFFVPVGHQHHRLAGLKGGLADQVGLQVLPFAGVLVVRQHHATTRGIGDQLAQHHEGLGLLEGRVALGHAKLKAMREDRDAVVDACGAHRLADEAGGLGEGFAIGDQPHTPVIALARGQFARGERQIDLRRTCRQHRRRPDAVRVVVVDQVAAEGLADHPGRCGLELRVARQRRVIRPQALAGRQGADKHLRRVGAGAELRGVDLPFEGDGRRLQVACVLRRDQLQRVIGLDRQAAHVAGCRDAGEVDRQVGPRVVGAELVDRQAAQDVGRDRRRLGLQVVNVEHQDVAGTAVGGVQLLVVGRQLDLGGEGHRDRRRGGHDQRARAQVERIPDDAHLGAELVGIHVLDQARAATHRQRQVPVEHEGVGQVGQDRHVDRVADVELVLLAGVVRQLQVDRLHVGREAGRAVVGDDDRGQAETARALHARGEDHLVGLGRGLDAVGLDTRAQLAYHLAELAWIEGRGIGRGRHLPVGLVDVDHQHLAGVAPALDPAFRAAKHLGRWRAHVQPRTVRVDRQVGDLARQGVGRRNRNHLHHLVQLAGAGVDVDDPDRALGGHVKVAAQRVQCHRRRVHCGEAVEHQVDEVHCRRRSVLVDRIQGHAVDHRHRRRLDAVGIDQCEGTGQIGAGLGGHHAAPQVDDVDDFLGACSGVALAAGVDHQHALREDRGGTGGAGVNKAETTDKRIAAGVGDAEAAALDPGAGRHR